MPPLIKISLKTDKIANIGEDIQYLQFNYIGCYTKDSLV